MSSDKTPTKKGDLTERELTVLSSAWKCFKNEPELDLPKLAGLTGYTNVRSCANVMGVIKKKLAAIAAAETEGDDGAADGAATTPAKSAAKPKKTPASRKRKANVAADGENGEPSPTPSKKPRAKAPKQNLSAATLPKDDSEDDDKRDDADGGEEDEIVVKEEGTAEDIGDEVVEEDEA
ncbi:hypothetical protein BJ170DRAFT_293047 [Xylariales sp. AK1849]|nr:hypothetical protein BJ170DRAFT_293047 [Xylariales sp. AK1849]